MSRPRLLLVNDDGIGAIRLQKLKTASEIVGTQVSRALARILSSGG